MVTTETPISTHFQVGSAPERAFWRRRLLWIVLIALLLRIAAIGVSHTYRIRAGKDNFGFGWEMGRIARSIATGHGFGNPFEGITGPTAWEPPVYPYIMAGFFKVFGIYTKKAAFFLLSFNSIFSALTCVPLFYLGRRLFSTRVGIWSAWFWAVFPYSMYFAVKWLWETAITTFLLTSLILWSLRLVDIDDWREWCGWGLLWGLAVLINPSVLSILPFAGLWLAYHRIRRNRAWFVRSAVAAILFCAVLTPWLIRNYRTFHQPVFLRTNLGAEFRMGNGPGAVGIWMYWLHPSQDLVQLRNYRQLGELSYVAKRKQEALDFIREDPTRFVKLCLARFWYYWANQPNVTNLLIFKNLAFLFSSVLAFAGLILAIRNRVYGIGLLAILMFIYPVIYYIVFTHPRYRAPLEPTIVLLIVYFCSQSKEFKRSDDVPVIPT